MLNDPAAEALLASVIADWRTDGPLSDLERVVQDVWKTNVIRHEPALGDDSISLGLQSARNICNRAVEQLRGRPGVAVHGGLTLDVRFGGRTLHVGKGTPDLSRAWSVWSVDWASSDVRDEAAAANRACYQPFTGTLLESLPPLPGQPLDLGGMRYLHLAWQGFMDEGHCRAWLGFPSAGPQPWIAVLPLFDTADGARRSADLVPREQIGASGPSFHEIPEAWVPVTIRRSPREREVPGQRP